MTLWLAALLLWNGILLCLMFVAPRLFAVILFSPVVLAALVVGLVSQPFAAAHRAWVERR